MTFRLVDSLSHDFNVNLYVHRKPVFYISRYIGFTHEYLLIALSFKMNISILIQLYLNWIKLFAAGAVVVFKFLLKFFLLFALIFALLLEYCDLLVFSQYIVVFVQPYDVPNFFFLWLLKCTPVGVLLCYVLADSYGIDKEKGNFLLLLMVFQLVVMLKTLLFFWLSVSFEDTKTETRDSWMFLINSYSLFFEFFVEHGHPILTGLIPQLGCNAFVFVVLCCHYVKLRLESKNSSDDDEVAVPDTSGIDLVKFIKIQ